MHSFQFWQNPERDVAEVSRVLRPGGMLLLVLRRHEERATQRAGGLLNRIARSGDEVNQIRKLLLSGVFEQVIVDDDRYVNASKMT